MKWFYNLRRFARNLIAGALWGVLFALACIVGGVYGDNVDNVPVALAVGVVIVFIAAIVFTVFAIIATRRQKQPDGGSNKKTTPRSEERRVGKECRSHVLKCVFLIFRPREVINNLATH